MRLSRTGLVSRKENVRDATLFIIATEGTHTEKRYFEELFQSTRIKVHVLGAEDTGESTPQHVLSRLSTFEREYNLDDNDQRWLVIDVDRWPEHHLRGVCNDATTRNYHLGVSNPCFELWLWLHFADADDTDTTCKHLVERLKQELGGYSKGNRNVSHYTKERIEQAISRAAALNTNSPQRWPSFPGTHVHKLVTILLPHLK